MVESTVVFLSLWLTRTHCFNEFQLLKSLTVLLNCKQKAPHWGGVENAINTNMTSHVDFKKCTGALIALKWLRFGPVRALEDWWRVTPAAPPQPLALLTAADPAALLLSWRGIPEDEGSRTQALIMNFKLI